MMHEETMMIAFEIEQILGNFEWMFQKTNRKLLGDSDTIKGPHN